MPIALLFSGLAVTLHTEEGGRPFEALYFCCHHPIHAFDFMRRHGLEGNLAVEFNFAQSALFYLHDVCNVAYDGRFRTVYPARLEDDYFHFHFVDEEWANLIDDYPTEMVLMPGTWGGIAKLEKREDWMVAYRSPHKAETEEDVVLFLKKSAFPDFEKKQAEAPPSKLALQEHFCFGDPIFGVEEARDAQRPTRIPKSLSR